MTPSVRSKLMVLLLALTSASCYSPARDKAKLAEVDRIWQTFPVFAGMQEVSRSTGKSLVTKRFNVRANYDDVKQFYLNRLGQDGWQFVSEEHLKDWGDDLGGRELTFRRADYEVTIQYAGEKADYGWDYAIGISWE